MNALPHVVIIGGGFAGLWATRALAAAPVRITLVDRGNHHLFQPLLYQVATAGLSAPDIAAPLRHILRGQRNVDVLLARSPASTPTRSASRWTTAARSTTTTCCSPAARPTPTSATTTGPPHAPGLKTLDDALAIRRRILLLAFERAEAETDPAERDGVAALRRRRRRPDRRRTRRHAGRDRAPHAARRIPPHRSRAARACCLIEAGPRVLAAFPEDAVGEGDARSWSSSAWTCAPGTPVTAIDADGYRAGRRRIVPRAPCCGPRASRPRRWARSSDVPLDRAGPRARAARPQRARPSRDLRRRRSRRAVQQDGKPVPGVAPAAKQMGAHVARGIRARLRGPSRHRRSATATTATSPPSAAWRRWCDLGRLRLSGAAGLVVLAGRARVLPDRLPQPPGRAAQLGVGVLELPAQRADHPGTGERGGRELSKRPEQ